MSICPRSIWKLTACIVSSAFLVVTLGPGVINAQAKSWSTAEDISSPSPYPEVRPSVDVNPSGNAVAVWYLSDGSKTRIQAATRAAGTSSSWSTPVNISDAGQNAFAPHVAIAANGDAVAVWNRTNGTNKIVQAATLPSGGSWSAPVNLSATGKDATAQRVAIDPNGNAAAVWNRKDDVSNNKIAQAATRPSGGSWSAVSDLSVDGSFANTWDEDIAFEADGTALAVWRRYDSGAGGSTVQFATRPLGGSWSAVGDISVAGQGGSGVRVAVDPTGNAVVVWERMVSNYWYTQASTRPDGGSWSAAVTLFNTNGGSYQGSDPEVAIDSSGKTVAVGRRHDGSNAIAQYSTRPLGGSWSTPVDLSAPGQTVTDPRIDVNAAGDAVAVWSYGGWTVYTIQASLRPSGGSWSTPVDLSASGERHVKPSISVAQNGDAVAVWGKNTGYTVQASIYALFPPVSISTPATSGTPHVGQTLTCSQGSWTNNPTAYAYQWQRGNSTISGAIGFTYTLAEADASTSITCNVTASNAAGGNSATSNAVGAIGVPSNTTAPAVSGSIGVGQQLTCSQGTWVNDPTGYSYQWQRGGSAISGATSSTYTLVDADAGSSVTCSVTASNDAGSNSVTSSTVGIPAPSAPVPVLDITPPTVTIDSGPGQTLRKISAVFTFRADEERVGFECQLDDEGWGPCGSPEIVYGLALGPHTFQVRAQDRAGNTGLPATWTWVVDRRAPRVKRSNIKKKRKGKNPAVISIKDLATISGLASDDFAGIKKVKLKLKITNPKKKAKKDRCAYLSLKTGRRIKQKCGRAYTRVEGTNRWSLSLKMKVRKRMRSNDRYRLYIQTTDTVGNQKTYGVSFRVKK